MKKEDAVLPKIISITRDMKLLLTRVLTHTPKCDTATDKITFSFLNLIKAFE